MSKGILSATLSIASLALFAIPGIGPALGLGAKALMFGLTASQLIGAGLMIAGSLLLTPKAPKLSNTSPIDRLYANIDVTTPRKIVFGNTAMATDMRYQRFSGSKDEFFEQIICVASHEVNEITEIWLDNEKAWSLSGGVLGRYATSPTGPFLWVTARVLGTSANGITIDGNWTANSTLTGCAYVYLKYRLIDGGGTKNDSPFASGITNRMTIRGKGARLYDPRLDSTVTGGSGAHRANDQATWLFSATNYQNPALQLLWYLLGWKINSKLAVGMGMPPARIDLPSFITAANICDELVTKNGGGTEKRYLSDGVLSEADDRQSVIETLCATMNAVLRDASGKIAITVLTNDLASPVLAMTEGDVLGDELWEQTPPLNETFNIVRGRRIDPSDNALYQPVDFPEVSIANTDGIDRIDTIEYPLVQGNGQAQRLAKQRLQRNQYQGRYSAKFGSRALQVTLGNVVTLSHQGMGWTNKLFRVASQGISREGVVSLVLLEENAAIYAWANDEAPAVVPGTPTVYDPTNSPLLLGINQAKTAIGNELQDTLFTTWTLTAGATVAAANATLGYAEGPEPYYLELSPDTASERSATSLNVPVTPGMRYFFSAKAQRGTTLGSGSRLNFGGRWIGSDGTTLISTAAEGAQQTPTSLTAGALPAEVTWSDTAPSTAYYFQMKVYTPALASSSGTFRVEAPKVTRHEPSATIDANIVGDNPVIIFADSTGTPKTGELSKVLAYKLFRLGSALTSGVTWSASLISGNATFTISGTGTATLTITGPTTSALAVESVIRLSATYAGTARTLDLKVLRQDDPPTSGGGGSNPGTTASTTTLSSATATTYPSGESAIITVKAGTAGQVACTAPLSFKRTPGTVAGVTGAYGKWQWRVVAGTFADITTEIANTTNAETVDNPPDPIVNQGGSISVAMTKTGLTSGTDYEFKFLWRKVNVSGDVDDIYRTSGTLQASGS